MASFENDIEIFEGKNVFDVLELIKRKPLNFLPQKTLSCLQSFLNGYYAFTSYLELQSDEVLDFHDFTFRIRSKLNPQLSKENTFTKVLLPLCKNDEEKAFNLFYEELEIYKKTIK